MSKKKSIYIILFALIITLLCNGIYLYTNFPYLLTRYKNNHFGYPITDFNFYNSYLGNIYNGIILWDKLVIVVIISFFIVYICSKYLFKNFDIKNYSNAKLEDKIFIIIFLIFLLLPMSRFDYRKYALFENRKLAKFPKIVKYAELNKDYFKEFSKYVEDRFFTRSLLISIYKEVIYNCAVRFPHGNRRFVDKKTKWLTRYYTPPVYKIKLKDNYYKFVVDIKNNLRAFNDYCNKNNIKFYVLIFPEKASIYHPYSVKNYNDDGIKEFIKTINSNNDLNIIFPIDELQKASKGKELLFYKTDHHLTNDGIYIGYKSLMYEVQKDFPDVKILNKNDFVILRNRLVKNGLYGNYLLGEVCSGANLTKMQCQKHLDNEYAYYFHKDNVHLKSKILPLQNNIVRVYEYNSAPKYKALFMGNSIVDAMPVFTAYTFSDVYNLRLNSAYAGRRVGAYEEQYKILKNYQNFIEESKPDMIIFVMGYDVVKYLVHVMDLE